MNKLNIFFNQINIIPNKQNSFIWYNILFVIALLITDRVDAESIVFAFFFETIIIGIVHVFKLLKVYLFNRNNGKTIRKEDGIFAPIFFSIHYGFFVAVQLIFVFSFMSFKGDDNIAESFYLLHNISYVITHLKGIKLVLLFLFITNLIDYYLNFIQPKKYKYTKMQDLFFQPYLRIIVQQFSVILGGFFMLFNVMLNVVAILLISIKSLVDLYFLNNNSFNELIKKAIKNKTVKN